jgi:hypothetical protein
MDIPLSECVVYSENAVDIVGTTRQPHPLLRDISYLLGQHPLAVLRDTFTPRLISKLRGLDMLGHRHQNLDESDESTEENE